MSDRSLLTVVTDGFSAPRWVHHLVKIATGALVAGAVWCVATWGDPFVIAAMYSLLWFGSLRVSTALDHGTPLVTPDLWCDLALHALPLAIVLAVRVPPLGWLAVLACGVVYAVTYPAATP